MRVILTAAAVEDLTSIRAYIAEDSPKAAERFARRFVDTCKSLGSFPN
jgi:plasmid stabilization system protein ParE